MIEMRNFPLIQQMLVNDWVRPLFDHLRNLIVCVAILAAGVYAAELPPDTSWLTPLAEYAGWFVIGMGTLLTLLNLADGYYRLSKLKHHLFLHILIVCLYLVSTFLLVRLLLFRASNAAITPNGHPRVAVPVAKRVLSSIEGDFRRGDNVVWTADELKPSRGVFLRRRTPAGAGDLHRQSSRPESTRARA